MERIIDLFKSVLNYFLAVTVMAVMTVVLFLLRDRLNTSTIALLYLLPVLVSTVFGGLWPGVFSAFLAFLLYNFLFITPYYTFRVHQNQDIVALLIFLVVAVLFSQLLGSAKTSLEAAIAREAETTRLYELSLDLARANSMQEISQLIAHRTAETIQADQIEMHIFSIYGEAPFVVKEFMEAKAQPPADRKIPFKTARANLGEILIWTGGREVLPSEERLIEAFAAQGALALERAALVHAETRAKVLEESDRLKSALLSSVSHEFRTPLATIKAATTSLLSDEIAWEAPVRKELLSAVDEETDHLNNLVGNLLDMTRIDAGVFKPNTQWNMLSEIVEGVVKRMHRYLSKYQVVQNIPDDLPSILVDYNEMEQVFTNLLDNSMKYAPVGSTIGIQAEHTAGNVIVRVTNEGPNVAPDHLDRIFEKFFRVTAPEKVSGTGLGLSICKGIIEAHGGRIWAENLPAGLAFVFSLPITSERNAVPEMDSEET